MVQLFYNSHRFHGFPNVTYLLTLQIKRVNVHTGILTMTCVKGPENKGVLIQRLGHWLLGGKTERRGERCTISCQHPSANMYLERINGCLKSLWNAGDATQEPSCWWIIEGKQQFLLASLLCAQVLSCNISVNRLSAQILCARCK